MVNFIFGEVHVDFDSLSTLTFWSSVGQIILIDILLGGDNAVVIALACRKLPIEQRKKGIFWGVFGAVGLRIVLIFFAQTKIPSGPSPRERSKIYTAPETPHGHPGQSTNRQPHSFIQPKVTPCYVRQLRHLVPNRALHSSQPQT